MAVRNYDKWEAAFFFLFFLYVACLGVGISPLSAFILAAKPCGDWWGVEFNPGEAASRRINGRLLQPKKSLANPPSYWGYNKRNKHKLWKLFIRFRSCFLFGEFRSVVVYFSPQGSWTSWWTCSYPIRSSETRRQRKDGSHQKIVSTAFFTLTPSLDDCRT